MSKVKTISDQNKVKISPTIIIKRSAKNINNIKSERYKLTPNEIEKKTLKYQQFRTEFNLILIKILILNILQKIKMIIDEIGKETLYGFTSHLAKQFQLTLEKRFLNLLDKHFSLNNQLHKIFNRNTVKVSYSCTPKVGSIIKSHNKKLTNAESKQMKDCNCRKKEECPLEGKCRSEDIIYKCVATAIGHQ